MARSDFVLHRGSIAPMAKHYRALISVFIRADDDHDARRVRDEHANSLTDPADQLVRGHLELVGEVGDDSMQIARVLRPDPHFRHQLPPDWKE
jgi:hypothetical protein